MCLHLVAYNINGGVSPVGQIELDKTIQDSLNRDYDESSQFLESVWLIDSDDSAIDIRNDLTRLFNKAKKQIGEEEAKLNIYVQEITHRRWATLNIPHVKWLQR